MGRLLAPTGIWRSEDSVLTTFTYCFWPGATVGFGAELNILESVAGCSFSSLPCKDFSPFVEKDKEANRSQPEVFQAIMEVVGV
jgi:hypothetical protein